MSRLLWGLVLVAGCAPKPAPLCVMPAQLRTGSDMRAEAWYRFLVDRGLDGAPTDCTGTPVRWRDASCMEARERGRQLPVAPFRARDLVTSRVSDKERLVWVVTQRFSNGDGLGPVALVREGGDAPEVIVAGSLRARTRRARLALVDIGGERFLTAEGEACAREDPSECLRSTVLLAERRQRFVPVSLRGRSGSCVGPAEFHLTRLKVIALSSGWSRRFELISTLTFEKDRILVQENVRVSDFDPSKPGTPPRIDRQVDDQRVVRSQNGRLVVSARSLWSRVLDQEGDQDERGRTEMSTEEPR